ncbi:MAG: hypothetical protein HY937_00630 [Nitrosomonadales bacterium]|nr:hypothetical protein [Nitrosomonadales bacterium]
MTNTFTASVIPAKAGIQTINMNPMQWDNTSNTALSAARSYMTSWIPAFAGMTKGWVSPTVAFFSKVVFNYGKLNAAMLST